MYRGVLEMAAAEVPFESEAGSSSQQPSIRTRTHFPETWLWESSLVNGYLFEQHFLRLASFRFSSVTDYASVTVYEHTNKVESYVTILEIG